MKRFYRVLSALLCVALLLPSAVSTAVAVTNDVMQIDASEPVEDIIVSFDVSTNNVYDVNGNSYIKLQFNTAIDAAEIEKVQIVGLSSSVALTGEWIGSDSDKLWQFVPYDIQDSTYYTIIVPGDLFDKNGLQISGSKTHSFRTTGLMTESNTGVGRIEDVNFLDCVKTLPTDRNTYGLGWNGAIFSTSSEGFIFNLNNLTSNYNDNQNIRLNVLNQIWQDTYYVGKVIRVSFDAKVDDVNNPSAALGGNVKVSLTQVGEYAGGVGFGALDGTAYVTNDWSTFTYEFTVTQQMFDEMANGNIQSPGLGLAFRFPGFADEGSSYHDVRFTIRNINVDVHASRPLSTITNADPIFVNFESKTRLTSEDIDLRFTVKNDSNATIGVYEALNGEIGSLIGTLKMNGKGVHTFDSAAFYNYIRSAAIPEIALKVESSESVDLVASSCMLVIKTDDTYGVLPESSSSVLATNPNGTQNGLYISGGQDGFDTTSVKSYVKLSLSGYTGGYASFLFTATTAGTSYVSVYGVADVNAGQNWTAGSLTVTNAPANDVYGGGVNMNEVYGNGSLGTFKIGSYENTYRVNITDFAQYMYSQGASEITLVLVTDSTQVTNIKVVTEANPFKIAEYDCEFIRPELRAAGYKASGTFLTPTDEALQIDFTQLQTIPANNGPNVRVYVLNDLWKNEANIGKTISVSFYAKTNVSGKLQLTLNQHTNTGTSYVYTNFEGLNTTVSLNGNGEWQKVTCEFVVTEAMFNQNQYGKTDGVNLPELALGVRFFDVNGAYTTTAKLQMRNFVVREQTVAETVIKVTDYDCVSRSVAAMQTAHTLLDNKKFMTYSSNGLQIDLAQSTKYNTNQSIRMAIFEEIWKDTSYIGKNIRFTFIARATESGSVQFSMNQRNTDYMYNNYLEFDTVELTTEWQTFTYEFTVTSEMYAQNNVNTVDDNSNLTFGVRFPGYKNDDSTYKPAQIYFKNFVINTVEYHTVVSEASVIDENAASVPELYSADGFADVKYDFTNNVPSVYSYNYGANIHSANNGSLVIDLSKAQSSGTSQLVRFDVLNSIFADRNNIGKTFTVTVKAKATQGGVMDLALNCGYNGINDQYCYSYTNEVYRTYYRTQYMLDTDYQTYAYTFTATEDMFNQHASNPMNISLKFYNGFNSSGKYVNVQITVDNINVVEEEFAAITTAPVLNSQTTNGSGTLTVYNSNTPTTAAISKSYFAYDLTKTVKVASANLSVTLSGANGEKVNVYLLKNTVLPANMTYATAPTTGTVADFSFIATNGTINIDLTDIAKANEGTNFVLVFAIESPSGNVQVTAAPELTVVVDPHDHETGENKHDANAPTYNAAGNVEYYTCSACTKLYVKNANGEFVETNADNIVLPPLEYSTKFASISLNIGKDLGMKYYVALSEGESIDGFVARFTLNDLIVEVTDATYDAKTGMYAFTFCGIAPQLMGDTVSAELLKNGQLIDQKDYSVRQYVEKALELYPDDQKLKQLLADLVHYGAAAQQYIGYKTDELVTDGLGLTASSATPTEADKHKGVSQSTNSNVQFTAAGVRFDYVNRIYVKFKAADISGVTVSVGGVNLEILETNTAGVYIAYSDAISALRFGEVVTFTLAVNGSAVQTLTYTVNDYAYAKHSDSRISDLALALYRYGKSAREYNSSK